MKRHSRVKRWFRGPEFLQKPASTWQNKVEHNEVDGDDKEVKIIKITVYQSRAMSCQQENQKFLLGRI